MTLDRMVQMFSILANLGVVAGFAFLAVQVQQNSEALKVQSAVLVASAQISAESSFIGEELSEAYAIALRHPQLGPGASLP